TTDDHLIASIIIGKIILITGAAGSIGQEITRQCLTHGVKKLVLVDQSENGLHDFSIELKFLINNHAEIAIEVASIRDKNRMRQIFQNHKPAIVFHAAAYKHVPIVEKTPYEGIKVNIFGTKIVADSALEFGVERFIMISTDKAVNPTNVMGATKRVAELYTQSLNEFNKTIFISTRFGNVLNSNGSVLPLFKKQIENGGPITVTHKDITRYFMTIPEASGLVLLAATIGKAKQVLVFDMGKPVKIYSMAEELIRLSGFEPHIDIKIELIGLRPGEKLYEELLTSEETTLSKIHEKIMVAKADGISYELMHKYLTKLNSEIKFNDDRIIVSTLKKIVPEFISENSEFKIIDEISSKAI
ncbi:polysaccharide biosynthesis protein, partial [Flavobacteriaceae bacterium]|nr:polysaccharide biosynthesis protein [Flavobacteriaceae bacterium]